MTHINNCIASGNLHWKTSINFEKWQSVQFSTRLLLSIILMTTLEKASTQPIFAVSYPELIISQGNFTATMTGSWDGNKNYEVVFHCSNCTPTQITANLSGFGFDFVSVIFEAPSSGQVIVTGEATGPDCDPSCEATPGPAALIILPVELVDFKARPNGKTVHLTWQTVSELENEKFIIERSDDGLKFKDVGEVVGSGTTTKRQYYQFEDEVPSPGVNYYRLRQVDFDGSFEHSSVRSVWFRTGGEINIYPTLFEDEFKVFLPKAAEDASTVVTIHNSLGKMEHQQWFEEGSTFSVVLPSLLPGSYWVTIVNGNMKKQGLIVKQ